MNKKRIKDFILHHYFTRELFFILGQRKINKKRIDKILQKENFKLSTIINDNLIVSLTSYGKRIAELKYTLYSLIIQTIRPYKIIVNLSYEDKNLLNCELLFFEKYGIEFNFCENLRSFKKLIPTMEQYTDKVIITVDDDMFYDRNLVELLWKTHIKYPNSIIAHNIYEITYSNNTIHTYDLWKHSIVTKKTTYKNFFVGCGGVLYPPNSLFQDYNNRILYEKLTPIADDIWFYFMAYLKNTKIIQPDKPILKFHYVNPYREYGIEEGNTLTKENVGLKKNDEQFHNVLKYYGITEQDFINKINIEYKEF